MNIESARELVRACLERVNPDFNFSAVGNRTELLRERVITSFQVVDLIIHLEQQRGRPIERHDLRPGCFRDIDTIASIFFCGKRDE